MNYQLEINDGKFNVYSTNIGMNVMEDALFDEVRVALATEMEYDVKMKIVKLLMTFPHGFEMKNGDMFVREDAVEAYEAWNHLVRQQIGFLDRYYALIDEKITDLLTNNHYQY